MQPIWRPTPEQVRDAQLTAFVTFLRSRGELPAGKDGVPLEYGVLHEWSVTHREAFWRAIADFVGVVGDGFDTSSCRGLDRMAPPDPELGPVWFDGAPHDTAVVARDDLRAGHRLTGPLVVEQLDTTTVVPPGVACAVDERGNLLIDCRPRPAEEA